MNTTIFPIRRLAVALATTATFVVVGCAATATSSTSSVPTTSPEACDKLASAPVAGTTKPIVVVVDGAVTGKPAAGLPPELITQVAQLQLGASLQVVESTPEGVAPVLHAPIALDPAPNNTSVDAKDARKSALGCLPRWLAAPATPSSDSDDVMSALQAALRQAPVAIFVVSTGLQVTSVIDLADAPGDPATDIERAVAAQLIAAPWPGVPVHWFNMGQSATKLAEGHRASLEQFWRGLIGDELTIHSATGATQ